ncbi:MAG: beta-N-acetylhexosaminidase, partial [Porticoccus sp.]
GCDRVLVCNNRKGVIEVLDILETYNWVPSARLSRMSRQVTLSWDSLIEDDRWKSVNAKLLALPKGK